MHLFIDGQMHITTQGSTDMQVLNAVTHDISESAGTKVPRSPDQPNKCLSSYQVATRKKKIHIGKVTKTEILL